jgi:hypothetical protein
VVFITQILLPLPLVTLIAPVPKAIALVFALLELKTRTVNVKLFSVIVPAVNVNTPETPSVQLPVKDKLISDLLIFTVFATAVEATETTAAVPELASKFTMSAAKGGPKPPGPPDKAAQLVVLTLSQVPDPPTQK